jgi:glutamyl-Q tRNA(Asp) synthetase
MTDPTACIPGPAGLAAEPRPIEGHPTGAGRFAPSPTGPLHLGSLVTALASWLDAKAHGLQWWVRMEDLDPPREQAGAAALILQQLRDHGLRWDAWPMAQGGRRDGVLYQSDRQAAYASALAQLQASGQAFACSCSRRQLEQALADGLTTRLADGEIRYTGHCRLQPPRAETLGQGRAMAWRALGLDGDDIVLKRADGLWAYHLAVVVDDALQDVRRIVRGSDLASAQPRQARLREQLGLPEVLTLHVPVVVHADGQKLSKQTLAPTLKGGDAVHAQLKAARQHLEAHMPANWLEQVAHWMPT